MATLNIKDENNNFIGIPAIKGDPGKDYVITDKDYQEIASIVTEDIEYFKNLSVDEPNISIETTEETAYIFIDKINDEAFSFDEMWVAITVPATTTTASRVCISDIEKRNRGLNIAGVNTSKTVGWSGIVHIYKVLGRFVIDSVGTNVSSWLGDMAQIYRDYHHIESVSGRENVSFAGETINSFNVMLENFETQPLPIGTTLKIWGRRAE